MDPTQNGGKRKKVEKVCKILALTWRAMVMMRNMLTMNKLMTKIVFKLSADIHFAYLRI